MTDAKLTFPLTAGGPANEYTIGLGSLGALPVPCWFSESVFPLAVHTGYAINPARDLGPRIAHALLPVPGKRDSDWGYAVIPVVAPLVGGFLAASVYAILKHQLVLNPS